MSNENKSAETEKFDPYKKYKDFKWEDPDQFKNGPVGDETRKCRDCFCCIILIVFILGCVVIAFFGFKKGKPVKILYGYDEDGNACGYDEGYKDYPYLYFYSVLSNLKSLNVSKIINAICVKDCPTDKKKDNPNKDPYYLDCKPTKNNTDCKVEFKDYYQSKKILNRFCFPSDSGSLEYNETTQEKIEVYDQSKDQIIEVVVYKDEIITNNSRTYVDTQALSGNTDATKASTQLINWSFFSSDRIVSWFSDVVVTKYAIAASVIWSFILAMLFLLFLRCCAGVIVYLTIFLVLIGLAVLCVFFRMKYNHYKNTNDTDNKTLFQVLFWVFVVITAIWLLFILLMCNRIRLAVALIKVTAKYVGRNCCIVFVPFLFFIILAAWIIYWLILSVYIYAAGDFNEGSKVIATFTYDKKIRYLFWYHLFALFYIYAVISSYSQFVYSSSAVIWYFTSEKGTEHHNILKSFHRGIRYHMGSLAFGSLIIAIVRFLMFFIEIFKKKIEATYGKKVPGKCYKCIMCCIQCCLKCIGKTIEFINKHAFIMIAIKGDCFCTAAWEGFALTIRNLGRFSVFTILGKLFCVIGTVVICSATVTVGYFVITEFEYFSEDLKSCVLPMICFALIGLIIGLICMKVFGTSGDALLYAFLVDEELNKGQAKAFPDLQKFMSDER